MSNIHQTTIIEDGAEIHESVKIGPFCWIKSEVKIAAETIIGGHCVIEGPASIGENNQIGNFVSIGAKPQDKGYKDEDGTKLIIGNGNFFGDYVQICRATKKEEIRTTIIGHDNYIMAYCHVGHDCVLGDGIVMANSVQLAGHVQVEDKAVFGGLVAIHQFCRVGKMAMLAGGTFTGMDTPPFCKVGGYHGRAYGLNAVGLSRNGMDREVIKELRAAYKILFLKTMPLTDALKKLREDYPENALVKYWIAFFETSKRGVVRDRK